jgi:carboxyl-terminal processing protease
MILPKYLNLFQEVRLGEENIEAGDLVMKVAQGNGLCDVVGMRLDDVVKKIKGPKGGSSSYREKVDALKVISIIRDVVELEETCQV